ncbi:hypothetical protein CW362_25180 [Streptomyces populi]|uniref:Uncharacterized protein n=1 Tax=Streptomyces populi TaxID=2058924 RepID=A0A2I0SK14_9ACTN|nr:hypothetical protein CW362_25180 [Streptomyces populi]
MTPAGTCGSRPPPRAQRPHHPQGQQPARHRRVRAGARDDEELDGLQHGVGRGGTTAVPPDGPPALGRPAEFGQLVRRHRPRPGGTADRDRRTRLRAGRPRRVGVPGATVDAPGGTEKTVEAALRALARPSRGPVPPGGRHRS